MTRQALIVAHGQPSAPAPPEAALADLAQTVQAHLPGWTVRSATLASPGRLEAEAARLGVGALIYPLFMAKGYFVSRVLPERLGPGEWNILEPLGLAPGLPELAANVVRSAAAGTPPEVLLAAHGSARGDAAKQATEAFATRLRLLMPKTAITTGYIEQAPFVAEAAQGKGADAICLPFFAQLGDHCREDIPEALNDVGWSGQRLMPLGCTAEVPALIAQRLLDFQTALGQH